MRAQLTTISFWVFAAGLLIGGVIEARDLFPRFGESGEAIAVALPIVLIAAGLVALLIWALDRSHAQVRSA